MENNNEIVNQLVGINEQLAIKNRRAHRIWTTIGIVFIIFLLWNILLLVVGSAAYGKHEITIERVAVEDDTEIIANEP